MRFAATTLDLLKLELERFADGLLRPERPTALFSSSTADMPPAADFPKQAKL